MDRRVGRAGAGVVGSALVAAAVLALAGAAGVATAGAGESGTIVVAGSGSNLPAARILRAAFRRVRPDVAVEVPESLGSKGGIRAAAEGAIALGLVSRPLSAAEQQLGLTVKPYARTAVVLAAHPAVPDDGLTLEELVQIYRGVRTRWRDGRDIVVLTREPGDSSIEVLQRVVPGFREAYADSQAARRWMTLVTDQAMNRAVMSTPLALGLSDTGAIHGDKLTVKALRVNGVTPRAEHVLAGRYPLVKRLDFVYRADRLTPSARAFLDFASSRAGRAALRAYGYLPAE